MQRQVIALLLLFLGLDTIRGQDWTSCTPGSNCDCGRSVPEQVTCRPTGPSARIVGGSTATPHAYPWLVSIRTKLDHSHHCGGSIIAPQWILTAAHCFRPDNEYAGSPLDTNKPENLEVAVAEHSISTGNSCKQIIDVVKIISHEGFGQGGSKDERKRNDIALLKLERPININTAAHKACAPQPGLSYDNMISTLAGWGRTGEEQPGAHTLLFVNLNIVPNDYCKKIYAELLEDPITITDNMMCTSSDPTNTLRDGCKGDSGGPLIVKNHQTERWVQVGVVTFARGCGKNPGVYTRVTSYLDWIRNNMR